MKKIVLITTLMLLMVYPVYGRAQSAMTVPAKMAAVAAPVMEAPMVAAPAMPAPAMPAPAMPAPVMEAPMVAAPAPMASVPVPSMAPAPMIQPSMAAAPAPAKVKSGEKKDTWWQALIGGLVQILILFGGTIASVCGGLLIKWLMNKAKISNQETIKATEELYDKAIALGVQFATQQANKLNNNPDAKAQRVKWATDMATRFIKEWNLPAKTAGWIEDRIEAKLGERGKKPGPMTSGETDKPEPKPEGDNG
jgi:hypothetical protein